MPSYTFYPFDEDDEHLSESEAAKQELFAFCEDVRERLSRLPEQQKLARSPHPTICVRLDPVQLDALDRIAREADTTRSGIVRQLLAEFIEHVRENGISYHGSLMTYRAFGERPGRYKP